MGTVDEKQQKQREYWNARSRTFPRFEEGDNNYEAGMLRHAAENGVDFNGKRVLDVGCGSGMYTLRLARMAESVTAVDVADEMLRLLREDAAAMGITNITTTCSGWDGFSSDERFDIVFASMTPAVESDESREKLMQYATETVVFMGFSDRMLSDVMQGLHEHYGIAPKIFNNAQDMRAWLDGKGVPYTAIPVKGQWVVAKSREDLVDTCVTTLRDYGAEPDPHFVEAHVEAFRDESGQYVERTDYVIEMIIWQKR
ncbi:class I SAM-dependent methyltransferase [Desulfovibrio sp.]|uniref:class I SAM-dependent methyltransferase n=1 Tax=Desulfovibrio sp. TaxID=885 RepID=UPI0025BB0137|nr:class I SAM-dependent methyltransferase [Desulfovibrio sp.]